MTIVLLISKINFILFNSSIWATRTSNRSYTKISFLQRRN
nr:MAG TPA: hypothetical protein [Caudoviricetes sp.]